MPIGILRQEPKIDAIDFTQKRLFVCGRNDILFHVQNTRNPNIRQVSVRDCARGMVITTELRNEDIRAYVARFGIDDTVQWWSEDNSRWLYQGEIDDRDASTEKFIQRISRVYFVLNPARNAIKIGYTQSLDRRFATLQNASSDKLELLGSLEGDKDIERELHARFAEYRGIGEWFNYTDDLRDAIEEILDLRHLPLDNV